MAQVAELHAIGPFSGPSGPEKGLSTLLTLLERVSGGAGPFVLGIAGLVLDTSSSAPYNTIGLREHPTPASPPL